MQQFLNIHENLVSTISGELVQLHIKLQEYQEKLPNRELSAPSASEMDPSGLADYQISQVCSRISESSDILRASKEWNLPIAQVVEFERKYSGMTPNAIRRFKQLEHENSELRQQLDESLLLQRRLERLSNTVIEPRTIRSVESLAGYTEIAK